MNEDWYKGKEEWCNPDRPFDPTWRVPPKQSVQTEMPYWKLRAIYGNNIPEEPEKRPLGSYG